MRGRFGRPRDGAAATPASTPPASIDAKTQAALTACQSTLPGGGFGGGGGGGGFGGGALRDCLEKKGVTVPTRVPNGGAAPASGAGGATPGAGGGRAGGPFAALANDPKTAAILEACRAEVGANGGPGGAGGAASPTTTKKP